MEDNEDIEAGPADETFPVEEDDSPQFEGVEVPVEDLGAGIFRALGDVVGGVIGLSSATANSLKKGVDIVKKKVSNADNSGEEEHDGDTIILDAELVENSDQLDTDPDSER
ncbi:MAG: hypothetical protein HQL72_04000 [Magnetococcales bacterium]|nr:hypothetical protein [Magnetococcales bacterium]